MSSKTIKRKTLFIIDILIIITGLALDRISKIYALNNLKDHPSVSVISGYLELHYLENTGAAFGFLKNQKSFFILVGCVILIACIYVMVKTPAKKKYIIGHIILSMIITGAIGNMTDRLLYNYVVDFIYVSVVNFPIFNIADIYITIATVIAIFVILFYYKEDDLNFLRFNEKIIRNID